jgi:hypothetical protein
MGVFHEAVPGGHARELVRRPDLRYTATPGGWLNSAEDELNSLMGRCSTGPPVWRDRGPSRGNGGLVNGER